MVAANFFLGTTIINLCICMTMSFAQAEAVDSESAIKSGVDLVKGLNPWIYPIIVILSAFLVAMIGGALMTSRDAAQDQDCIDKEHAMEVPDSGWGGGGGYGKVHGSAIQDLEHGKEQEHGERDEATTKQHQRRVRQSESNKKKNKKKHTWTDVKILAFGLTLVGFDSSRQQVTEDKNIRQFRGHYGVGPKAIAALIKDLKPDSGKAWGDKELRKLFIGICWLKLYETEEVMAGRWDLGEDTCRNTAKLCVTQIQSLKKLKITFRGMNLNLDWLSVDGVHFHSSEMRPDPHSKWYSHKFNGPGFAYEVALDTVEDVARWTNDPKPAATHDLTFLRGGTLKQGKKNWDKSALYFYMPKGVRLVGDSGYSGQDDLISTTDSAHDPATKELFARFKSRQETYNTRLKFFAVLGQIFCHGKNGLPNKMKLHQTCFDAVCVLVAYDVENGHPLFEA